MRKGRNRQIEDHHDRDRRRREQDLQPDELANDERPKRRRGRPRKTDLRRRPEPVPTEEVRIASAGIRCPACGRGATLRVDHTRTTAPADGIVQYGTCSLCGRRICRRRQADGSDTVQVLP